MRAVLCALLAALAALAAAEREPRGAPRCTHERCRFNRLDDISGALYYEVDGSIIMIFSSKDNPIGHPKDYLEIYCKEASVLNSPALPSFESMLHVSHLEFKHCPPPDATTFGDTLAALNVTLEYSDPDALSYSYTLTILLGSLSASAPLRPKHFVGLERLVSLIVNGDMDSMAPTAECAFLTPLQSLRSLELKDVMLPTCELYVPPSLRTLHLRAYNGSQMPVVPALEELSLSDWTELRPTPLSRCDSLRELRLYNAKMIALPDGWLVNCSHLKVLDIIGATNLVSLPPKLLFGMKTLKDFSVMNGELKMLPAELLDYSPELKSLQLRSNRLKMLKSGMFNVAHRVQKLDLSQNKLESSAVDALAPLVDLTELYLTINPSLGDVCSMNGYSPIRNLTKLMKLRLKGTGVTRICRDWRENMTLLEELDLSWTNVTKLSFQDLQFTRTVEAKVTLLDLAVPVTMEITREDYNKGAKEQPSDVNVQLDNLAPVACDCSMYWTRRVLDLSLPVSRLVDNLLCTDGRQRLRDVPSKEMVCARPDECAAAELPTACACDTRPDDASDRDRLLVRVRCENASLTSVPRPRIVNDSTERLYELLLNHNRIGNLTSNDLHRSIKYLDLRSNLLQGVDEVTAKKLGDFKGTLRLADNPLECDCHVVPLQRALRSRDLARTDWNNVTCSNGSALYNLDFVDCLQLVAPSKPSLGTWLASVLAALLALSLIIIASLASRERRFFMRAVLHRWGFVWRADEPADDDDYRYDAFVTFSHKDEALVPELIARLEPIYQLCVHYRDWTPGHFISDQVVESVRESRRTIALVSRHFLASSWARAEFREAHSVAMLDARPRLIVILLEEPAALEMDDILRRYVATHTYLRWGEPWFWDKLAVALPKPRAPGTPETTTLALLPAPSLGLTPAPARPMSERDASESYFALPTNF